MPHASPLGMFWNDTNPSMVLSAHQSQDAAAKLGLTIQSIGVHDLISFDSAFAVVESGRGDRRRVRPDEGRPHCSGFNP